MPTARVSAAMSRPRVDPEEARKYLGPRSVLRCTPVDYLTATLAGLQARRGGGNAYASRRAHDHLLGDHTIGMRCAMQTASCSW